MSPRSILALFLAGALLLLSATVQAQIAFSLGPQVGGNVSTAHFPDNRSTPGYFREDITMSSVPGVEGGLLAELRRRRLAVQSGVLFAQRGYVQHREETSLTGSNPFTELFDERMRLNYLTVPVNLVISQRATGQGLQAFVGAYWGLLTGGRERTSYCLSTSPYQAPEMSRAVVAGNAQPGLPDNSYSQRTDAGAQAGLGYRYRQLLFQASYSWGLRNLAVDYSIGRYPGPGPSYYNRAVHTSLSYLFAFKTPPAQNP